MTLKRDLIKNNRLLIDERHRILTYDIQIWQTLNATSWVKLDPALVYTYSVWLKTCYNFDKNKFGAETINHTGKKW